MIRVPGSKNLPAKLLALIMAVGLWIYVMNEQNPLTEASYQVPLEIRNSDKLIIVDAPESAKLRLRGPRNVIATVSQKDLKAYVDLNGLNEGKHIVQVHAVIPAGLEVLEVNPDKVTLRLDAMITKELPIEVRMTGSPAAGVVVAKTDADADRVVLQGAKSLIDTVDRVVAVIDVAGRNADFSAETPLAPLNREGKAVEGVTLRPGKLTVSFVLTQGQSKKTVNIKPNVDFSEVEPGYVLKSVVTEPGQAELTGATAALAELDAALTEPIVLKGLTKPADVQVKLQLKDGIAANINSVVVHIDIDKKP